ncbi:50S ribosomal protein L17 [Candidatus Uhrbacteria bacterium]|nr:50S ribosomal protein L17 [Candidatus Uhrbacteria bacterium]
MRHRKKGFVLDRAKAPRKALLQHLAESLVYHEKIVTTHAKARAVQPFVEKLITIGKQPTLAHRRQLLKLLPKPKAVSKVLEVLSVRYQSRPGGYTRRVKLAARKGDNAEMSALLFVESAPEAGTQLSKKA